MSSVLLDTNVLLFFLTNSPRLSGAAREKISDPATICHVSMASLWEIALKQGIGKLRFAPARSTSFRENLKACGFEIVPIEWPAMLKASELPYHHRDPFDRLIIAEALLRGTPVLSTDQQFDAYRVDRIA